MNHFDRPRAALLRANAAKLLWTDRNARGLARARRAWPNTRQWVRMLCRMTYQGIFERERIDRGMASWWPSFPPDLPS